MAFEQIEECETCGTFQRVQFTGRGQKAYCVECGSMILRSADGTIRAAQAWSLAGLFLFFPAMSFPVMRMELWNDTRENTIWSGVRELSEAGMPTIAVVVLFTSIIIPLLKIVGMLVVTMSYRSDRGKLFKTYLFEFIHRTGHWSFLDIFLVAILIALLQIRDMAYAAPEIGLAFFTAMVVCTMFASMAFNTKAIWRCYERV